MLSQIGTIKRTATKGIRRYPYLFSPFQLGSLELRNRAMVSAMTTNFAEADGSAGESLIGYLVERAKGGFGSIVTENIGVDRGGRVMPRMLMGSDDRYIPGLNKLASAVHAVGGVLIGQISHAGRQTRSVVTGRELVAPSAIPCPLNREMPRALLIPEIEQLEMAFVDTAERLAEAGFDGIEIHGGHGYLVAEFLSAYSNKRSDLYGGTLHNRMRFLRQIIRGIRRRLGDTFPLLVRISGCEFVPEGIDVQQAISIASQLYTERVDGLSVSVGVYESFNKLSMITGEPEGQWLPLAGRIKAATNIPIIGVGRIKRASIAESALSSNLIDIAAFGRASIADPYIIDKIKRGRQQDIVRCLSCNVCLGRSARPETICPVNPLVGRERLVRLRSASQRYDVIVYGTSIAAMTAAWVASSRGHSVTLIRGHSPIGGMQAWRARVPGMGEYAEVVQSILRRATQVGVRVSNDVPAVRENSKIWRTRWFEPIDWNRLSAVPNSMTCYAILSGKAQIVPGQKVMVIGNDLATAEAALVAAEERGCVTLYISTKTVAADAHPGYREVDGRRLTSCGVRISHEIPQLTSDAIVVVGHTEGADFDNYASWCRPSEYSDYLIADAYEPGLMTRGIYEAFAIALDL